MFHYSKTYMVLGAFILGFVLLSVSTKTESNIYDRERGIDKKVVKCMERGFDYASCKKDPTKR